MTSMSLSLRPFIVFSNSSLLTSPLTVVSSEAKASGSASNSVGAKPVLGPFLGTASSCIPAILVSALAVSITPTDDSSVMLKSSSTD